MLPQVIIVLCLLGNINISLRYWEMNVFWKVCTSYKRLWLWGPRVNFRSKCWEHLWVQTWEWDGTEGPDSTVAPSENSSHAESQGGNVASCGQWRWRTDSGHLPDTCRAWNHGDIAQRSCLLSPGEPRPVALVFWWSSQPRLRRIFP